MSIIALWVLVLFETGLLLLLLRALGELRQRGGFPSADQMHPVGLDIGERAPSFVAMDYDGNPVKLEDFQGQRRIVAFVSPSCSLCAGAIQALNEFLQERHGWAVLVIGDTDRRLNQTYATEYSARMPILTPDSDQVKEVYHVQSVPFVFLLDEGGSIRAKGVINEGEHLQHLLSLVPTPASISH